VWNGDISRDIKWLRWIVLTKSPSHILLFLGSIGRIRLLLRNVHERRRENWLVLGRINIIARGRIDHLIRLRWINNFPLRGVNILSL